MLSELERRHDLWQLRLGGWSAWVLVRWAVAMGLAKLPFASARPQLARRHRLALALGDALGWLQLRPRRVLAQGYSSSLLEEDGGRFKDIWLDELVRRLESAVKIEQVNSPLFLDRHRHGLVPALLTTELIDGLCSLLLRARPPAVARAVSRQLTEFLRLELGAEAPSETTIETTFAVFHWKRRLWHGVLARVAPRIVLVTDPGEFALVAAAKEHGARVVEIQHGIIDRYNPSYSWPAAALPHRAAMPIPDLMLLHGEHWKRELGGHHFWGDALRVAGNPRVDLYRGERTKRRSSDKRRLVFTSQGIAVKEAAEFIARCLELVGGGTELEAVVKLHPVYDEGSRGYAERLRPFPNVRIVPGNEAPSTLALLASADIHVSISSATHYDALALRVPTVILPLPSHQTVAPLVNAGHALLAADPAQLAALATGPALPEPDPSVSTYYCRPGAVDNMLSELTAADEGVIRT
jgi:hypothetical protein